MLTKLRLVLVGLQSASFLNEKATGNQVSNVISSLSRSTVYRYLKKADKLGLVHSDKNFDGSIDYWVSEEGCKFLEQFRKLEGLQ